MSNDLSPAAAPITTTRAAPPAESLLAAIQLLRDERLAEADLALAALLDRWPGDPDALHFQGVLRHAQGRSDEGVRLIQQAIEALPATAGPWNNLGNILLECDRHDEALEAYETGVRLAGDRPEAANLLNNIATIWRRRRDWLRAERASRQAVAARPDAGDAWYGLSLALIGQQRIAEGLLANSRAITLWPRHLMGRDQVIRALLLLGEREQAARLYREWLAAEPDNPVALHQLAACEGGETPSRASDAYVEKVFDSFASSFDAKLESLQYAAPRLVAAALAEALPDPDGQFDIVDLGCGTGLVGPLLRPWARRLAGCDLSTGMLRRARQRRVYDALHKAELVYYLQTQPDAFDVIVSADTLCYFGDLEPFLIAACLAARPGGALVFTVEAAGDDPPAGYLLQCNGRYRHSRRHLVQALPGLGFAEHHVHAAVLRQEAGAAVWGWVITARRAESGARTCPECRVRGIP